MTDNVLTEEEKGALLDGMATGMIEVQARGGPRHAEVREFEIGARSRIVSNSYPRLQHLNKQFAGRLRKNVEQLINADVAIASADIETCVFDEFAQNAAGHYLVAELEAPPLAGSALLFVPAGLVDVIVESFYGGTGEVTRTGNESFTPGEKNVLTLFVGECLRTLKDVWRPVIQVDPRQVSLGDRDQMINCIDDGETVIGTGFDVRVADEQYVFHVVWPLSTVAPLIPVFEGQKRDRDEAEDVRWARALKTLLTDSTLTVASHVGKARLTLRDIAGLVPGQIIGIDDPREGWLCAERVPLLRGRFGIHRGRYAIEATGWIDGKR